MSLNCLPHCQHCVLMFQLVRIENGVVFNHLLSSDVVPFDLTARFDNLDSATRAKQLLNGADIYSGCCTLKIEYANVSLH